jgi:peptidoglycan-N-acetylglucosamine deacetylase
MYRKFCCLLGLVILVSLIAAGAADAACTNPIGGLSVARVHQIDTTNGPMFGSITNQIHEPSFLKPKEVVLTFDDGPMPWVTKSILDTLDTFCTKATFFSVGRMALSYPATVKDIVARGHTLGTHTYTHPFNMPRMNPFQAQSEIEHGLAAVTTAAGTPIAPFFRFTGLADSRRLLAYLQARNIATFTVDVVSNDSYIHDVDKLTERTMSEVHRQHGGIILFHDIKTTTAKALPAILTRLKAEGYSVVHIVAKEPAEPLMLEMRDVAPKLALTRPVEGGSKKQSPLLHGAIGPEREIAKSEHDVTALAPEPRERPAPRDRPAPSRDWSAQLTPVAPRPAVVKQASEDRPAAKKAAAVSKPAAGTTAWQTGSIDYEITGPPVLIETDQTDAAPAETTSGWGADVKPRASERRAAPGDKR